MAPVLGTEKAAESWEIWGFWLFGFSRHFFQLVLFSSALWESRPCGSVNTCASLYSREIIWLSIRAQEMFLGLSKAAMACLVLFNDVHRFIEFPFRLGCLCCPLLRLEICLKTPLEISSFSVQAHSWPCFTLRAKVFQRKQLLFWMFTPLYQEYTHTHTICKIYICTYTNSNFFLQTEQRKPF